MYKSFILLPVIFFMTVSALFSAGTKDTETDDNPLNNEWVLNICALDVSSLPPARHVLGDVILKTITDSLRTIEFRTRSEEEFLFYQGRAWARAQNDAAMALASRQNDRDLLVFRGEPAWRYQRTLRTHETDIQRLEAALRAVEAAPPAISRYPKVNVANPTGPWPLPPVTGEEFRFCVSQGADAFLTGSVSEFHGRIFVTLKLYTLYTGGYSWEDELLFSSDDFNLALDELDGRLHAVISGIIPAGIIVHAEPENAMIIINDHWAGRGEVPLRDHLPGNVQIAVYADDYFPVYFPLEIRSGEIAELFFNLTPLGKSTLTIDAPESPGSSVFLGSLFMGVTPLSVELSGDSITHISVETPLGEIGSAVFGGSGFIRGNAEFVQAGNSLVFSTAAPPSPEDKRVQTARNKFYSAYARLWVALPVSLLVIGMTENYVNAYLYSPRESMYERARTSYNIRTGAYVLLGLTVIDTIYRIFRYVSASGNSAEPIAMPAPVNAGTDDADVFSADD